MYVMPNFNMDTPMSLVSQRLEMIQWKERGENIVNILNRFNVSKPLFYKFYNRYKGYGKLGLYNLSKAPHNHGRKTTAKKEDLLCRLYKGHPYLSSYELHELVAIPPSTIQRILKRNRFVKVYMPKKEKKLILAELKRELQKERKEKKSKKGF